MYENDGQGRTALFSQKIYAPFVVNKGGLQMRALFVLLMLAGCSYNATFVPRGGGETLKGLYNHSDEKMAVVFDGAVYVGGVVRGRSTGVGASFSTGGPPVTTVVNSASNQYSSTMLGPKGAMRCDFAMGRDGGNGICIGPDSRAYDLVLEQR